MYDLSYVRRFIMALAVVLSGVTGLFLLYPYWTPPPPAARPVAPRVVFRMHDQRTPMESSVVWSPALIALAGPGSGRSPADRVGSLAPPLKIPELRTLGIVRQSRTKEKAGAESRWPWIWQLVGAPTLRTT
ncbi:MAG: hypothetical protein LC725_02230, partial [Lentisphaerae bacterium]|nr:hypothetical protein [Lentisphaerota bacterium]